MKITIPSRLSDNELVAEVARLARCERDDTTALIEHLAELFARRLHERAGFSSLFTYCVEVLRLSESAAYDRMKAAKVVRRYPAVLGLLAAGRVNLTTIRLLAPRLTRENQEELFAAAAGKRKRQVQELLARRFPQSDVASSVRKLPAPRVVAPPIAAPVALMSAGVVAALPSAGRDEGAKAGAGPLAAPEVAGPVRVPAPPRPLVRPLAADRYQITFTTSAATCETLALARDLLRHAIPNGDVGQIFDRSLELLVQELVRQKFAVTDQPRSARGQTEDSRNIPAEVRRAVFIRDRGRCVFAGTGGRRCGERAFVEFHHVRPYEAGGPPTVDNIELRCKSHNSYEAEMFYGPATRHAGADIVKEAAVRYGCVRDNTFSFRNENTRLMKSMRCMPRSSAALPLERV